MRRVLLIDDDPLEAKLLDAYLRRRFGAGCLLVHVRSLHDGISALRAQRFDAVLLDNRLPPFADYRDTLPLLRIYTHGVEPIVISASLRDACFAEEAMPMLGPVVDKFDLKERIGAGLLD